MTAMSLRLMKSSVKANDSDEHEAEESQVKADDSDGHEAKKIAGRGQGQQ
jgi:hypothetical protein